jgi:nicotinamidase-related amidase
MASLPQTLDPTTTALFIGDMQNGFMHPQGAYARGGATAPEFDAIVPAIRSIAEVLRARGGLVVASQFTIPLGRGGVSLISPHLKALRPFLGAGAFAPGSFDQQVIAELDPLVDARVEKVAFSAFHASRLEHVLRRERIETLICTGIVTNGGVASTVRDAHTRDIATLVVADGCAAMRPAIHAATLADLANVTVVTDAAAVLKLLSA